MWIAAYLDKGEKLFYIPSTTGALYINGVNLQNMNEPIAFYNGAISASTQVQIELVNNQLCLYDEDYNDNNGIAFPLSQCRYVLVGADAFVYLDATSTRYIILPEHHALHAEVMTAIQSQQKGFSHKLLQQKWPVLLGVLFGLLVFIYFLFTAALPSIAMKLITVNQEIKLGKTFYEDFTANQYIDGSSTELLQSFADELHLSEQYPIKISVVDDTLVNAFAFPGGRIVVYKGIIRQLQNPQEMIALLAHETSHVNQRHTLRAILSQLSFSFMFSFFTNGIDGMAKGVINNASQLYSLHYSRSLEREADEKGMELMLKNHVNPIGMKWLMEELKRQETALPESIAFLSTHPLTEERLKNAAAFAQEKTVNARPLSSQMLASWHELKKIAEENVELRIGNREWRDESGELRMEE